MVFVLLIFGALIGIPLVVAWRQVRQDRRNIIANGVTAEATITSIGPISQTGHCVLHFSFQPNAGVRPVQAKQQTTQAAIEKVGLLVGSTVPVRYLPKWPKYGFIDAVTLAERILSREPSNTSPIAESPALFYVYFAPGNGFGWYGGGDMVIADATVRFTAQQRRLFWFPKTIERDITLKSIVNVERFDAAVSLQITEPEKARKLQFVAVNAEAAESIARMLSSTKTESFTPLLAERAAFNSALLAVTPNTPVTLALIAVNVFLFLVATALGGGLFKVDPEVLIRLGTDYSPLTHAGQWWRLLTSIFLHFGLFHIALNMWVLYVNGRVAERIFGSLRYLVIYLVAGIAGSVASLLWHPIVNGAGASGAIFGILGAMIAFFLKRDGGVPASVIKAQLTSVSIFVAYSLLNAARYQGIDNAAHVGGLVGGFLLGFILSRPLDTARNLKQWTLQWATALGLICVASLVIAHLLLPPILSLGGIRLEMTSDELVKEKGWPIVEKDTRWVYNSVDSRHDGVLTVYFVPTSHNETRTVWAIEFVGHDQTTAPKEMPFWNSVSSADVILKYGEPVSRRPAP
jgi:membrane associated rhomboid family serine protease